MLNPRDWSWLGFLKIIPVWAALATGGLSVWRDAMLVSGHAPEPAAALWTWLRITFVLACGIVWIQLHKRVRSLERRMEPRMVIRRLEYSEWPAQGATLPCGRGYHFTIENLSETESLEQIQANIVSVQPALSYFPLPVPMKVKNKEYVETEFTINPLSARQIDLVTGPSDDPTSQRYACLITTVRELLTKLPEHKYRVGVKIGAKNTPPVTAMFEMWVDQRKGLQCVLL
jgi:hypothetical protein